MEPGYGHSTHYLGNQGQAYFSWQNQTKDVCGQIEARKFAPFLRGNDCVVDFGCGGGFTLKNLRCRRRIGVEVNPAAHPTAVANGVECYTHLGELPDGVADVVISNHALEHVPNPILALKEMRRVLAPNGVLVLIVPIDDWRANTVYRETDINHHLYTWTPQLMGNCLVEAGFQPSGFSIDIFSYAWFPGAERVFPILWPKLFDALCGLFSVLARRRQVRVVARNQPAS